VSKIKEQARVSAAETAGQGLGSCAKHSLNSLEREDHFFDYPSCAGYFTINYCLSNKLIMLKI
jgi:hypothetical protein